MRSASLSLLVLSLLFGVSAAAAITFRTRVFCHHPKSQGRIMTTLLSPSATPLIFDLETERPVTILSQSPIWSDNKQAEAILVTKNGASDRQILLTRFDFARKTAQTQLLGSHPEFRNPDATLLAALSLEVDRISMDETKSLILAPDTDGKAYALLDLRTGTVLNRIWISPEAWFNPVASNFSRYFTLLRLEDRRVRIGLWDSEKMHPIPFPRRKGMHQLEPRFLGNRLLTWLEWNLGRAEVWIMDLGTRTSRKIWETDASISPLLAVGQGDAMRIALIRESGWPVALPAGSRRLSGGGDLILLTLDPLTHDVIDHKRIDFPASLSGIPLQAQPRLFMNLTWSPWEHKWVMAKGTLGGLTMVSQEGAQFEELNFPGVTKTCRNPRLAPEYVEVW